MGTNVTADILRLETTKVTNVDLDAGATKVQDGATVLFGFEADNSANTVDVYVKIYDGAVDPPNIGSTDPELVRRVLAGDKLSMLVKGGDGFSFATHLYAACVITAGTGGTTAPTNDVPVTFWTD